MRTCSACKNRSSNDRCMNKALPGVIFCGVHSRTKTPKVWSKVNGLDDKALKIQKNWKRHFIRKRLMLAGKAVLKRSLCVNEEDPITLDLVSKIDPFDFFSFEEDGKMYGLDVRSFGDSLTRKNINPFTRQPFSMESRKRFREILSYRIRRKLPIYYEDNIPKSLDSLLISKWTQVCQIIEEHGFFDIRPNIFMGLNKNQLLVFLNMVFNDLKVWASEHNPTLSSRFQYVFWIRNVIKKIEPHYSQSFCSFNVASILNVILYDCVDPYNVCFIIMSALYRL